MARRKSNLTVLSPLPGSGSVDNSLVEQAVRDVNRICMGKGLETAREVGSYLLDQFFSGDSAAFEAGGKEHLSFRALAERSDLQVSASFLWYAIKLQPQLRQLPADIAAAMPLSHHRLLLHVQDVHAKTRLAEKVVDDHLSKRQLEEEVRKLRIHGEVDGAPRGRPPLPVFVKAFNRVGKILATADLEEVDEAELLSFGLPEARDYLDAFERDLARLATLRSQLAARVAAIEARVDGAGRPR